MKKGLFKRLFGKKSSDHEQHAKHNDGHHKVISSQHGAKHASSKHSIAPMLHTTNLDHTNLNRKPSHASNANSDAIGNKASDASGMARPKDFFTKLFNKKKSESVVLYEKKPAASVKVSVAPKIATVTPEPVSVKTVVPQSRPSLSSSSKNPTQSNHPSNSSDADSKPSKPAEEPHSTNSNVAQQSASKQGRFRHWFGSKSNPSKDAVSKDSISEKASSDTNKTSSNASKTSTASPEGHVSSDSHVSSEKKQQKPDNLFKRKETPKQTKKLNKNSLQEYLEKAGYDVPADKIRKYVFRGIIGVFLFVSFIMILYGAVYGAQTSDVLFFMLGLWTVVFAGVLLFCMACVYFFLDYRIYARTKEIEEVFPDFLQLASSNISAGMPVDKALWYAIRPNFGVLAKEMEEVAKATMTGEDLEVSLLHFANKYNSQTIRRSINILIEGMRAGGEISDLLDKIALNIQEMKIMKKEMAANVTTYAIFITFAAVIIAPFLFALATELLTIIIKITGSLDMSSSSTFAFSAPDPSSIESFKIFSIVTLVLTAMFSTAIVSVIKYGRVMEGIKSMPLYAIVSVAIYYFAVNILHSVFATII